MNGTMTRAHGDQSTVQWQHRQTARRGGVDAAVIDLVDHCGRLLGAEHDTIGSPRVGYGESTVGEVSDCAASLLLRHDEACAAVVYLDYGTGLRYSHQVGNDVGTPAMFHAIAAEDPGLCVAVLQAHTCRLIDRADGILAYYDEVSEDIQLASRGLARHFCLWCDRPYVDTIDPESDACHFCDAEG